MQYINKCIFLLFSIWFSANSINVGTTDQGPTISNYQLTIDANWRWVHENGNYQNCFDGSWKCNNCNDCVIEGVTRDQYEHTYGVKEINEGIELKFVTGSNVGSRLYVLKNNKYLLPNLLNKEISIDVDISELPCGLNSAVYLVEMKSTQFDTYGIGYGDAQCPKDIKYFSDGRVNTHNEEICATEIDLIEANSEAMAWTLHPCNNNNCDKSGADANSYRQGFKDFFGPGKIIDTKRPFTVITQFIGDPLKEVKRLYKQNGKLIEHPGGSLTSESIAKWKQLQHEPNTFELYGGFDSLTKSIKNGMALVLSIWDDPATNMKWLDSDDRGPCKGDAKPRQEHPDVKVKFTNLIINELNIPPSSNFSTTTSLPGCADNYCSNRVCKLETNNKCLSFVVEDSIGNPHLTIISFIDNRTYTIPLKQYTT
jgi:cellulose 1,4-beta-cellobiosidase